MSNSCAALRRSLAGAVVLLAACGESVQPGPADHLSIVSGNPQTGFTLDTLPEHLVVRATDDAGKPVVGIAIEWSSSDPDGRFIPVTPTTDARGEAKAIAVLGFVAGGQSVRARALAIDAEATFSLTATPHPGFKAVRLMQSTPGGGHMCGLDAEGAAWCWGSNFAGELGDGTRNESEIPRPVATAERFERIWGSFGRTCALTAAGSLWCWGGQNPVFGGGAGFGNEPDEASVVPVPAASGLKFAKFDLAGNSACGITLAGDAYCWGRGGLGNGTDESSVVPVLVSGGPWRDIAVDDARACATGLDYKVSCWASTTYSLEPAVMLGIDLPGPVLTPTPVPGIPAVTDLSVGWYNQCGAIVGGGAVCWGFSLNGSDSPPAPGPVFLQDYGRRFERVITEAETAMGLTDAGRLFIWGEPPQCCDGWISTEPVPLGPAGPWRDMSITEFGAFAISAADSVVYRWIGFPGFGPPGNLVPHVVPAP